MDVFRDKAKAKEFPPAEDACGVDILPDKASTLIGFIATNDTWWEDSIVDSNGVKGDVVHVDQGLCLTATDWIEHAAWSFTSRLLHLLRADVNTPPDWVVHFDVLVDNVCDLTSRSREH